MIADKERIGADGFDQDAGGQEVSFAVEDVAAARLEDELALGVLLRPGAQFIMPQNLQIDQPVSQPGEGRRQEQRQRDQSAILQSSAHTKCQPPAAIGSSPDGVTGGGKRFHFIRLALSCNLPAARGDRFLIRRRHGRRQNLFSRSRNSFCMAIPSGVLAFGVWCGQFAARVRQPPYLRRLRADQAQVQFFYPHLQEAR